MCVCVCANNEAQMYYKNGNNKHVLLHFSASIVVKHLPRTQLMTAMLDELTPKSGHVYVVFVGKHSNSLTSLNFTWALTWRSDAP